MQLNVASLKTRDNLCTIKPVLAKNLNNAYFRDNVENDDVKNTGFNLFLFKDTIVKIEFE